MSGTRALRYLAPNLITTANLVFGMLSLAATARGDFVSAGWFILYSVLFDRLDGFVARLVRGTSELGVQLDSFADFLNFGVAPAFLVYVSLGNSPALPFTAGWPRTLLLVACLAWVLAATFRLARYNITTEESPEPDALKIFFGVPTTLAGGLLITWYLSFYKYGPPGEIFPALPESFGGMRLFGDLETPVEVWYYIPVAMLVGAYLMASSLRVPKLGLMRNRVATVFVFLNVFAGYVCGLARMYPEYLIWPPSIWLVGFLIWGQLSPAARRMRPPPIFPPVDPLPGQEPKRPEDDMLPEGTDAPLDEPGADPARPPS
jgi:CDP-diacylglycerol---serine O-phosphatidyltransferase